MPSSILLETLRVARLQHRQLLQAQRPHDVVQPFGLLEHLLGLVLLGLALLIPLILDELLALLLLHVDDLVADVLAQGLHLLLRLLHLQLGAHLLELLALAALGFSFQARLFFFFPLGFEPSLLRIFGRLLLGHQALLFFFPSLNNLLALERGLVVPRRRGARHVEQSSALRRPFGVAHLLGLVVSGGLRRFRHVASQIAQVARRRRRLGFFREP